MDSGRPRPVRIDAVQMRRQRLASGKLYVILAARQIAVASAALDGGADVVQLRDKHAGDGELIAAGRELRRLCDRHGALLIVNDRPDLAVACGADGVHLGQDDEPLSSARATVGPDLLIGVSTHTPAQIAAAEDSDADYLGVGPVYETPTKPGVEPVGLDLVRAAVTLTRKPFFAIGGIDSERAHEVIASGASRIAVVRAIADADDPRAAASTLSQSLEGMAAVAE
jgi:thiamine-phosphate pyrophosphorylase